MHELNVDTTLSTVHCGECGGVYAIQSRYREQKKHYGGFWTCPYCASSWGYPKEKSEIERLKRQVESERKRTEWAQTEARNAENRRRAAQGQVTRIKNRVGKGVCPCCNRTFQNLHQHMKKQHPEWVKETNP